MKLAALVVSAFIACGRVRAQASRDLAAEARRVEADCTVSERVGPSDVPLPLDLSNALLDHPDLAAFIVRRRKIAPYRIQMLGPRRSLADDGDGTSGVVDLVERGERRRLYYGEGEHRSRLWPVIRAEAVISMELDEHALPDGREATRTSFVVCVRMRSRFVSGVVKILRPFIRRTVIGKFTKAFLVADRVGRLMAADPVGVAADIAAFGGLPPEARDFFRRGLARLKPPASR